MSAITYHQLPHPLREGDLLYYDPEARLRAILGGSRGTAIPREALGADAPPEGATVQRLEARLRRADRARARAAWGWALWWALLGPALALLWVNFAPQLAGALFFWLPPLAALIASLGAVSGGPLLAAAVGAAPLGWGWLRAGAHVGEARRWGRLAALSGGRAFSPPPALRLSTDEGTAAFAAASAPLVTRLREAARHLAERGADGAAELAQGARQVAQLAQRHALPDVAGAYHAVFTRFDAAEQRLAHLDRSGGLLAERRGAGAAERVRRQAEAGLASFAPTAPLRSNLLAPVLGLLGGGAVLGAALLLTGTFFVEPGQAVIVDVPGARLARLGAALGPGGESPASGAPDVVRAEGYHWTWPAPFAERHAVTLGEQRVPVVARFRQTGPATYDVVAVEIRFRISDVDRWAQIDRDGNGAAALAARLSAVLQGVLQQQRQDALQEVRQQNPNLANDPAQLAAQADQLVAGRMDAIVRAFVGALSGPGATQEAGVQISPDYRSQLVRGVPASLAGAGAGG